MNTPQMSFSIAGVAALPARLLLTLLLVSLSALATPANLHTDSNATTDAAANLRARFFARDFEGGYVEGKKLVEQFPAAAAVKVWFVLNASRHERADEALALAEKWQAAEENNGWSWLALAAALNYHSERGKEALAASEKMLTLLPGEDDAVWLRATIIRQQGKLEDALAFIEEQRTKVKNPAELLVIKASALFAQYYNQQQNRDEAKLKACMDAFAEALKADAVNVNALYLQGSYLLNLKKPAEAHALLKKALTIAPHSTSLHSDYWRATNALPGVTAEAKQQEVEADIAAFLKARGDFPGALLAVMWQYETLKLADKKKTVEDRILQLDRLSREAEWVLVNRARQLASDLYQQKEKKDPAMQAAYQKLLRDYVNRPRHFHKGLLGESYRNLFFQLKEDPSANSAELLAVAKGMMEHEKMNIHSTYPAAAIALAERKTNFREAEAWARAGILEAKKKIDSQRQFYKTEAEYEKALNWMTAMMYDALGWVFFHEGRLADAERELLHAHKLSAEDLNNLNHIGQFYQAKKDFAKAEEYFIKGALAPTPGDNKNVKALKALYELRHGNLEGYDKYLAKVGEMDAANRKVKVLADRLKEPQPISAFQLKTLDGKTLSSADLKGKVVVINYWGIWCGWCVEEMPEFQKLHQKYKGNAEVVILTINNDQNPADVPKWMQKHKYDFNVLFDDGFVSNKANINSFPTTWFLDKDGRLAFVKIGWTQKLEEEFSWRIEALKAAPAAAN